MTTGKSSPRNASHEEVAAIRELVTGDMSELQLDNSF